MSLDRHPKATRPAKNPKLAKNDEDFEPCTFFLYGTLMDPAVLMVVAFLQELPALRDAYIDGYRLKMWNGIYPTLLPTDGTG